MVMRISRSSAGNVVAALSIAAIAALAFAVGCSRQTADLLTDIDLPGEPEETSESHAQPATHSIPAKEGEPAPDFELPKAGGGTAKLGEYEGKVLVLDFWGTKCLGCIEELAEYQKLYDSWDHDKVEYLGLALDRRIEIVEDFVKRKGLTLPTTLCDETTIEAYLGKQVIIPQARVIDQNGVLRYVLGPGPSAKKVEEAVEKLLMEAE